jgi:hypothetical protein
MVEESSDGYEFGFWTVSCVLCDWQSTGETEEIAENLRISHYKENHEEYKKLFAEIEGKPE